MPGLPPSSHRSSSYRLSLRMRLALLVLVCVLPLLALNLANIQASYQQERERAGRQALDLARSLALVVEGELRMRLTMLEVLSLTGAARSGDIGALRGTADAVVARQAPGTSILLLRKDGQPLMSTAQPPGESPPLRAALMQAARGTGTGTGTGRAVVSDLLPAMADGAPGILLETPVRDGTGRVTAMLAMRPPLEAFDDTIGRQWPGRGWVISLPCLWQRSWR